MGTDSERLDWLEKHGQNLSNDLVEVFIFNHWAGEREDGDLRRAVDAAMAEEKGDGDDE